jgi:hypothetical protein
VSELGINAMTSTTLNHDEHYAIEVAIRVGDIAYARELVRDFIKAGATADVWYLAAMVASSPQQEAVFLEKALELDPLHERAREALEEKSRQETVPTAPGIRDRIQQVLNQRRT